MPIEGQSRLKEPKTKMKAQSKVTQYILSQIGLQGSRKKTNIAGWAQSEIDALPAGTKTTVAYAGPRELSEMSMPVGDVLAAGFSAADIARAIEETDKASPSILVRRLRTLTAEELAAHRKGYISPEVAEQYWPADQVCQCSVDVADLKPDDVVVLHYLQIG